MRWKGFAWSAPALAAVLCSGTAMTAQPTDLSAFHRSGQTFITWSEDAALDGEGFHVYRHDEAITAANLGDAERLTDIWGPLPEGTSAYHTERDRDYPGPYPGLRNYVITDLGPELADGTGLLVVTTRSDGARYYAVTTVDNGIENTTDLGAGNTSASPVNERVADPDPVLVWQSASGTSRVYTQFVDFAASNPTFDRPDHGLTYGYNYWVGLPTANMCGGAVPEELPMYLQIEGFGSRYSVSDATTWGWCAVAVWCDDPRQSWYYGFSATHDYRSGTTPTTGPIVNFTEQRVLRALHDTMRSPLYSVDEQRVFVYGHSMGGSGALALGMRYPNVFAATYSSEPMTDYATSGDGGGVDWRDDTIPKWGSLAANLPIENRGRFADHLRAHDGTGVWDWQNHQAQLVARRGEDTALISLAHGVNDVVIEWTTQGRPAYEPFYLGRRAFSGETLDLDHSWAGFAGMGPMVEDWRYTGPFFTLSVIRDETIPALSYASGSSGVPPAGAGERYNMNIEWSASWNPWDGSPIDRADEWRVSLRTTDSTAQTVDVTPRRLQAFNPQPGQQVNWRNLRISDGGTIASGTVTADADGLVTVESFEVTAAGTRLHLLTTGGGNLAPTADFSVTVSGSTAAFEDRSTDNDGSIVSWSWNFGDGDGSSERHPTHTYDAGGTYSVRLTVTDDGGADASAARSVTIADDEPQTTSAFRREWVYSGRGIAVFNDQLSAWMTEEQVRFCATRYAGTQKMTRYEADRLRAVNPDFMILHYRLGHGLGYRGIEGSCSPTGPLITLVEGDDWVEEWPGEAALAEDWFYHWPEAGATRVLNCDWGWYLMELDHPGWRRYWHTEVLRQIRANDADGVFMDSLSVPNYLGADHYDPVFPSVDEVFETAWAARIENWLTWLQSEDVGAYHLIPNVGQWITSRETTSYLPADGVMVEGFALDGSASPYPLGDWRLQMNRILGMVNANRALVLQSYTVWEPDERMFILGSYLLIKGERTYLNLDIDVYPEWWPEYDIPIGAPTMDAGPDIDGLWDADNGVYRRAFDNGEVLVNPDPAASATVDFAGTRLLVTANGGGSLPSSAVPTGSLSFTEVTRVTLPPARAAVLLDAAIDCSTTPAAPTHLEVTAESGSVPELSWRPGTGSLPSHFNVYRSSGGCPGAESGPILIGEADGQTATFSDSTAQACVGYAYVVTAADASNTCESAPSSCVTVTPSTGCGQSSWRRIRGRSSSYP